VSATNGGVTLAYVPQYPGTTDFDVTISGLRFSVHYGPGGIVIRQAQPAPPDPALW
jgi:hypothetical protein